MPKLIQTRTRLGQLYGVDKQTISCWLKRIGIMHSCALTPLELELFVTKYGTPEQLKKVSELLNG
ncbi:MAG: hypothetical protein QY309_04745 [Cyclobacteriaceae bacterium]|nr:MAG: hypothetical protein QY309_04745 [Cyclobacteriaceae bacterium]